MQGNSRTKRPSVPNPNANPIHVRKNVRLTIPANSTSTKKFSQAQQPFSSSKVDLDTWTTYHCSRLSGIANQIKSGEVVNLLNSWACSQLHPNKSANETNRETRARWREQMLIINAIIRSAESVESSELRSSQQFHVNAVKYTTVQSCVEELLAELKKPAKFPANSAS